MSKDRWYLSKDYWEKIFTISEEDLQYIIEALKQEGNLSSGSIAEKIVEHHLIKKLEVPEAFKNSKIFSPKNQYSNGDRFVIINGSGHSFGEVLSIKRHNDYSAEIGGKGEHYYVGKCDTIEVEINSLKKSTLISNSEEYNKIKQKYITPEDIVEKFGIKEKIEERLSISQVIAKDMATKKYKLVISKTPDKQSKKDIAQVSVPLREDMVKTSETPIEETMEDLPPSKTSPAPHIKSKILLGDDYYSFESLRDFKELTIEEWEQVRVDEVSIILMFANIYNGYIPYNQITKKLIPPDVKTILLKDKFGELLRLRKSLEQRMFYNYSRLSKYLQKPNIYAGTKLYLKRLDKRNEFLVEFKAEPKIIKYCRIVKYDKEKNELFYEYRDIYVEYECIEPIFKTELRFQDIDALWEEAKRVGLSIADLTYLEFKKLSEENKGGPVNFYDIYYKVFFRRMCSYFAVWSVLKRHSKIFKYIGNKFWIFLKEGEVSKEDTKDIDIAMPRKQFHKQCLFKKYLSISMFIISIILLFLFFILG